MKNVAKKEKKVFTKKKGKDIIKKDYNPLKANYKICEERDGLYMKKILLKEIRKEIDLKEKFISYIFPKTFIKIYGIATKNATNKMLS